MVAVRASEVEALLRRSEAPRNAAVVLVYGPDAGLVAERARMLAQRSVADPADPFQLVKIEGDDVAADPLRLADEANTIGLFGGRRAIWVKPTNRNLAPAVTPILSEPPRDALVVIEAGELPKSAPLRLLCERSPAALALPCYPDEARDLAGLVDETLAATGLSITRDARALLITLLGGNRTATRAELAKLALYAHGRGEVTAEDVEAVVGDVSALAVDAAVDAAYLGDLAALDRAFGRLGAEGTDPGTLLGFAVRHGLALLRARLAVERGGSVTAAAEGMRGLHFKRKAAVERQLRLWTGATLQRAVTDLGGAVALTRRQGSLADELALKALWGIALTARRAAR